MSNEVLGVVAANIGIKDLIYTAVCFLCFATDASYNWYRSYLLMSDIVI